MVLDKKTIKIESYLNNSEIENYFLKGIGFYGNKDNYSTLDGSNFMIKKTELDGNYKMISH